MTRRVLTLALVISLGIVASAVAYQFVARHQQPAQTTAPDRADSGSDFLLEGRPVRAFLDVDRSQVAIDSSITAVLRFTQLTLPNGTAGLGNEHDGFLEPTLQAADCGVQTPPGLSKSTKSSFPEAFVWEWTITCDKEGVKNVQVTLAFRPVAVPNDSDPIAFRKVAQFNVVASPGAQTLKVITALGALGAFISAIALLLDKLREFRKAA